MAKRHPVSLLCKIAHVSKSGYYKWLRCQEHLTTKHKGRTADKSLIIDGYQKSKGIYGYPRIKAWFRQSHGIPLNHK
ncbi:IS3 family transposase [Brevibacillus parabrevis]|uniref:IS3 family transposase n=1 Tax=Brevibacillus parabrevis TaxID=54914 RepID=UPI0035A3C933